VHTTPLRHRNEEVLDKAKHEIEVAERSKVGAGLGALIGFGVVVLRFVNIKINLKYFLPCLATRWFAHIVLKRRRESSGDQMCEFLVNSIYLHIINNLS